MTKREIEIKVRLNEKEAAHLNRQVEKCRLPREAYLRHLIAGAVPRRRNTSPSCGRARRSCSSSKMNKDARLTYQ